MVRAGIGDRRMICHNRIATQAKAGATTFDTRPFLRIVQGLIGLMQWTRKPKAYVWSALQ